MTPITEPWTHGPHEPAFEVCEGCGNDMSAAESDENTHPFKTLCAECLSEWVDNKERDDE